MVSFVAEVLNSDDFKINLFLTYNLCVCVYVSCSRRLSYQSVEYTFAYISFSYFLEFWFYCLLFKSF